MKIKILGTGLAQWRQFFGTVVVVVAGILSVRADDGPSAFHTGDRTLFIGDSITDGGRQREGDDLNHIMGQDYGYLIAARTGAQFPGRHLNFINRGISGNKVVDLQARWQKDALDLKPDILSILIGVNDASSVVDKWPPIVTVADYEKIYDQLIQQTLAALPKVRFILCDPFALPGGLRTKGDWQERQVDLQQRRAAVARLAAKYHLPVVHFQKIFDDACQHAPSEYWLWDGIHPTYAGHQLMADEWLRVFNDFYSGTNAPASSANDPTNTALIPVPKLENDSYDWYQRHADVLALQQKIDPEIVLVGDSITHFWGGEPRGNHQNGPRAWQETFGNRAVLNLGFGWDRTQNVLWRLEHGELDGLHPKVIVLNIGTNNFSETKNARANSPPEICDAIELICGRLRAKSPASRLIVMGVFPRGAAADDPRRAGIKELNSLLAASLASQPNLTFLDIGAQMLAPDGSISKEIMADGTHPTDKGYAIWGKALIAAGI